MFKVAVILVKDLNSLQREMMRLVCNFININMGIILKVLNYFFLIYWHARADPE